MLDLLEVLLGPMGLRLPFVRLDGSTPVDERQRLIDKFQRRDSKVFAFLLSTRAGGQGINLTAADTVHCTPLHQSPRAPAAHPLLHYHLPAHHVPPSQVFLHDLDWNPMLDRQAEDRAHRIGQQRAVSVHRLISVGTVEESILRMQTRKRVLGDEVLQTSEGRGRDQGSRTKRIDEGQKHGDGDGDGDDVAEVDGDEGTKLDSKMMNDLIEHALGLQAGAAPR